MEETTHPSAPHIALEEQPAPANASIAPVSRELQAVLVDMADAICTVAERVDIDNPSVQEAIATLRALQKRIEAL